MNTQEALDIMQSDMKLWETATEKDLGGGKVEKTLSLPWGIGEVKVVLEGMTDADKRRSAVAGYGGYIRDLIKERIDDEAITSRAQTAAARLESANSADGHSLDAAGGGYKDSETAALPKAGEAHDEDVEETEDFGATLIAREAVLLERTGRARANLAAWDKELQGIEAALKAMGYTR